MEYDLKSRVKSEVGIFEAAAGASSVSAIIDTQLYNSLTWLVDSGTITTGDFTALLEESDVVTFGGEETAVAAEETLGTIVFAVDGDDTSQRVGVVGKKRYQRFTLVGANSPVGEFCVTALLGTPKHLPTAD